MTGRNGRIPVDPNVEAIFADDAEVGFNLRLTTGQTASPEQIVAIKHALNERLMLDIDTLVQRTTTCAEYEL